MGELKPIGSEKLKGSEKIKRILEIANYQSNRGSKVSSELIKESKSGVYGIVKERDGYYVKKGLNENSLDYIGGMFMKNKNRFTSYKEAFKKLDFLTEQENVQEATKYVLKQNKPVPAPEMAAPAPEMAAPPPDGGIPTPVEEPMGDEFGGEAPEGDGPNDFMKVLQKMTGRLQQKMNTYKEKLESENYKAIINQILSAVDFDKLSPEDTEEILSQFEDDDLGGAEPTSDFPTDNQGEVPAPQPTNELDGVDALEELINTPLEDDYEGEENFDLGNEFSSDLARGDEGLNNDHIPLYTGGNDEDELDESLPIAGSNEGEDQVVELDLDELTNAVNNSVKQSLGKYFE